MDLALLQTALRVVALLIYADASWTVVSSLIIFTSNAVTKAFMFLERKRNFTAQQSLQNSSLYRPDDKQCGVINGT